MCSTLSLDFSGNSSCSLAGHGIFKCKRTRLILCTAAFASRIVSSSDGHAWRSMESSFAFKRGFLVFVAMLFTKDNCGSLIRTSTVAPTRPHFLVCQDMLGLASRLAYGKLCHAECYIGASFSHLSAKSVTEDLLSADVILTPVVQRIKEAHKRAHRRLPLLPVS